MNRPETSTRIPVIEILKLIHELHQRLHSTILIVTHDAGVADQCLRTVKLRDGQIVEDRRK